MGAYPASARERAMKAEEVILRVVSKQLTFWQAASILRISPRHLPGADRRAMQNRDTNLRERWKSRAVEKSARRLSHRAWKSRQRRGISTFPPLRRRRFTAPRRSTETNQNRTFHLLINPDKSIC